MNDILTTAQAHSYIQEVFGRLGLDAPYDPTAVRTWFRKGLIQTVSPHRDHSQWMTTYDWIDEAIMWKRIPPRKGRPAIAKRVEFAIGDEEYVATQGCLL